MLRLGVLLEADLVNNKQSFQEINNIAEPGARRISAWTTHGPGSFLLWPCVANNNENKYAETFQRLTDVDIYRFFH